ncbi:MAG TPA: RDD family protein, partial [Mycobacteriales bacterium]|nr:RDD family protein [Mycobacteriales bacterium]
VVRDDGGPIRFRHALIRGLLGLFVDKYSPVMFFGVITCLASERGKRTGDIAAGTLVLQERVPTRTPTVIVMPPPLAAWAATLDLSGLTGDLALAVREFLGRAGSLTPAARDQLGRQLYAAVSAVVTPPPPPGVPGGAYLAAVLAERRRREEERMRASATAAAPIGGWGGSPSGTPSPWGSDGPVGSPSPWVGSAPVTGPGPYVGPPPSDPGPPAPVPTTGPFAPPG